jgi:hypothetical protein
MGGVKPIPPEASVMTLSVLPASPEPALSMSEPEAATAASIYFVDLSLPENGHFRFTCGRNNSILLSAGISERSAISARGKEVVDE